MRMSEGVEWTVHCLSALTFLPPGRALPAHRLAELHGVPAPYLAKHLQALVRARILDSSSGPKGGFRLARRPEDISLLDIVNTVDGEEPPFRCTEIRQRGPTAIEPQCYKRPCGIAAAFARAEAAWRAALEEQTLADLVRAVPTTVHPRQLRKAADWLEEVLR